jgi:glycosyltransferase involved in cell wall biosynthesis
MSYALCYVCDEYPAVVNTFGGMGVAFREQAETFARLGRRVDVICRTTDRPPGIHCANGVRVHVVAPSPTPKARVLIDRLRLAALIRRICTKPSDLVISAEYAGPFLVKAFSNPLIVQLEGSMTVSAVEQQRPVGRVARFFERRTVDLADAVAAVSRFGAQVTLSTLGARPRDVHVFPNSVNAARFHPAPDEVDASRMLFVGKLNRLKGLFVLADALPRVFARLPSASLTLIGADHVEDGESCLTRFLGLLSRDERARVRVLGRLPHPDVARELRQCAVMVLPSLTEMCPVAVLEAMSCGRPVVASDRGGIPEMVQPGRTGLLADPDRPDTFADALIHLLADRDTAEAMGAAGRRAVLASYTSEALVRGLQRFYDELSVTKATGPCAASPVS